MSVSVYIYIYPLKAAGTSSIMAIPLSPPDYIRFRQSVRVNKLALPV